jgi:Ankyrin repeats (3 copies)/Fic/DOC family
MLREAPITFQESEFDLNTITQFNPAIIYGFDPELSICPESQNPLAPRYVIHGASQHQDVLDAYKYAQSTILPTIQKIGLAVITPENILYWADQIHLRIAATLANDAANARLQGVILGGPTISQISRWHHGPVVLNMVTAYLSKGKPLDNQVKNHAILHEFKEADFWAFFNFLLKIRDQHIEIPDSQKKYINFDSEFIKGELALHKLAVLHHSNCLTTSEKEIVTKFVKICPSPTDLPEFRQRFTKRFLAELQTCQRDDIDQVAKLAFTIFYGITEEHWYFNGNGRTATCLMNTFLVALGKPSILIRDPGERDDPQSSYSKTLLKIDSQPELLMKHIKNRIQATEVAGGYQNEGLAKMVSLRVKISKLALRIKNNFPNSNIVDVRYTQWIKQDRASQEPTNDYIIRQLNDLLSLLTDAYNNLENEKNRSILKKYNLKDASGTSLAQGLRRATANAKIEDIKYFIDLGCEVNQQDENPESQKTALHWAVIKTLPDAIEILVAAGAKINIQDAIQKTALDYAKEQQNEEIVQCLESYMTEPAGLRL